MLPDSITDPNGEPVPDFRSRIIILTQKNAATKRTQELIEIKETRFLTKCSRGFKLPPSTLLFRELSERAPIQHLPSRRAARETIQHASRCKKGRKFWKEKELR
jgi:hypothetical protein